MNSLFYYHFKTVLLPIREIKMLQTSDWKLAFAENKQVKFLSQLVVLLLSMA